MKNNRSAKRAAALLLPAVMLAVCLVLPGCRGTDPQTADPTDAAVPDVSDTAEAVTAQPASEITVTAPAEEQYLLPALTYEVTYPQPTDEDFYLLGTEYGYNYLFALGESFFDHAESSDERWYRCVVDFESSELDTASAARYAMYYDVVSPIYERLFSDAVSLTYNANGEPSTDEPFPEDYALRYSEENMQFLFQYVLNMEQPFDRVAFLTGGEEYNRVNAYADGYYFFKEAGIEFDFSFPARIKEKKALNDHKYQFTIEYISTGYTPDTAMEGEGTLVAALKEVNGMRFWSIYSYHADVSIGDLPEQRPIYQNTGGKDVNVYKDHTASAATVGTLAKGESIVVYGVFTENGVTWGKITRNGVSGWVRMNEVTAVTFSETPGSAKELKNAVDLLKGRWITEDESLYVFFGYNDSAEAIFVRGVRESDVGVGGNILNCYASNDKNIIRFDALVFHPDDYGGYETDETVYADLSSKEDGLIRINIDGDANGWREYHYANETLEEAPPEE